MYWWGLNVCSDRPAGYVGFALVLFGALDARLVFAKTKNLKGL